MGIFHSKSNGQSLQGIRQRKHDPLFYKGVKAAQEGRYTAAELYFHKVLFQNPVFLKYSSMLSAVAVAMQSECAAAEPAKPAASEAVGHVMEAHKTKPKTEEENGDVDANQNFFVELNDEEQNDEERRPSNSQGDGKSNVGTQRTVSPAVTDFMLPTGKELDEVLEFSQLQQDVEHAYTSCGTPKAFELAMVYAQINCLWQQIFCYLLQKLWAEFTSAQAEVRTQKGVTTDPQTGKDGSTCNLPANIHRGRESSNSYMTDDDHLYALALCEEFLQYFLINSSVNYGTLALMYAEKLGKVSTSLNLRQKTAAEMKAAAKERDQVLRRQHRIYKNVDDLCQMLIDSMWAYTERAPEEYINKVLLKILPPRTERGESLILSPVSQTDGDSQHPSSLGTKVREDSHLLTKLTETLRRLGSRMDGGTFLVESRTMTPYSPIVLDLHEMKLPLRMVFPPTEKLPISELARFESPVFRETWQYTKWSLPPSAAHVAPLPAADPFLLSKALPQFYTEAEGGAVQFSEVAIPGRSIPSGQYVDMIIEYMHNRKPSDDEEKMSVLKAAHISGARPQAKPNTNINLFHPQMRVVALMDELAISMKSVYLLAAKAKKLRGDRDGSSLYAACVVMQTACLRGADSAERLRMQTIVRDMGLM